MPPEVPADLAQEPPMRFVVVIGNDGRISREVLISGNRWLVQTAVAALREWVYEPTLVNEKSVAVVTEVRIGFRRVGECTYWRPFTALGSRMQTPKRLFLVDPGLSNGE